MNLTAACKELQQVKLDYRSNPNAYLATRIVVLTKQVNAILRKLNLVNFYERHKN
jgi:hypothetical protein